MSGATDCWGWALRSATGRAPLCCPAHSLAPAASRRTCRWCSSTVGWDTSPPSQTKAACTPGVRTGTAAWGWATASISTSPSGGASRQKCSRSAVGWITWLPCADLTADCQHDYDQFKHLQAPTVF
uniref:Putative e3 ubiquitin-protein ligase herc4 n=1 Tax=Ixodes ricinus TaxID=34613 RepID=A0A0K8RD58_IXORI